ncbi:MAG: DUF6020 family protein [Suilimivivens sp.]
MEKEKKTGTTAYGKRWPVPFLFSLAFSVCMIFGRNLDKEGSVPFKSPVMWLSILVLTAVTTVMVYFLWNRLLRFESMHSGRTHTEDGGQQITKKTFCVTSAIIFLCYLPVFLAVYPGFFVYDAQDELMQVITRNFSTHHPLIHVLFLGGIIQLVHKISGSYNLGIACYTLIQMLLMSCMFSYGICRLRIEGLGKKCSALLTIYFGVFPTIVMFSLCSAKDGLFTGMLLLMVMMLRELVKNPEQFYAKKTHVALLAFSSLFMMLLRHNGFYALLVFAVLFLILHGKAGLNGYFKKILILFMAVFAGYLVVNKGLAFCLQADDSEHQEMLTVPIQQMARVYTMEGDTLSEEEKNTLYEILPKEALRRYTPKVSDGVKVSFNNEAYEKDPGRYLSLWMKIGMKHPFAYLNAWFMTSYGFWYPDTVIDVYRGNTVFTFTYEDSSYFGYEVEQPGERHSFLPLLDDFYRWLSLDPKIQQIPVISWLFSPGFLFWIMAFMLGYFWYAGQYKKLLPYLLPALVWLTVILGPTYLVRYVVFLWVLVPMALWDLFSFLRGGSGAA